MHAADHLRVARRPVAVIGRAPVDELLERGAHLDAPAHPCGVGGITLEFRRKVGQRLPRVGDDRQPEVLDRVERGGIHPDDRRLRIEGRPGPRREVLQPRAHRQDQVRLGGHDVGCLGTGDADRTAVARMRRQQ